MENEKLNKILVGIICGLALVILAGTVYGLLNRKQQEPEVLISKGKAENLAPPADTAVVSYFDLEKIRVVTKPEEKVSSKKNSSESDFGTPMVINAWLAYPEGDTVFYEELARKRGVIKGIFISYFSSHSKKELLAATETRINEELLKQINGELSLGKILEIYYTDYLFLE